MRNGGRDVVWSWDGGVRNFAHGAENGTMGAGGPLGLLVISVVAGAVSGVAEALGALPLLETFFWFLGTNSCFCC